MVTLSETAAKKVYVAYARSQDDDARNGSRRRTAGGLPERDVMRILRVFALIRQRSQSSTRPALATHSPHLAGALSSSPACFRWHVPRPGLPPCSAMR